MKGIFFLIIIIYNFNLFSFLKRCDLGLQFKDRYYSDEFTTPIIPKNDAKKIIENSFELYKGLI